MEVQMRNGGVTAVTQMRDDIATTDVVARMNSHAARTQVGKVSIDAGRNVQDDEIPVESAW